MKNCFALILVVTAIFLAGLASTVPFSHAAGTDLAVQPLRSSIESDVPILFAGHYAKYRGAWLYPYQRDAYSKKCLCCWYEYPSEKCRSMPLKNCAQRGGKCKD